MYVVFPIILNSQEPKSMRLTNGSMMEVFLSPLITLLIILVNNGVYKTGFATNQQVYEKHCRNVFASLDRVEAILSKDKFLVSNTFTEADIRLFTTILRCIAFTYLFNNSLGSIQFIMVISNVI